MNDNSHLSPQLDAYALLMRPGFALLIDAPWGAGKTHALKGWMAGRNDTLYVSLYGAINSKAIEEALFLSVLERRAVKPPQGFTKLAEGVTEKFTGAKVDLTGAFRRAVMKDLPQVLVFDDLERTEMPLTELFSAINRFVEHEGRNVVLLANQNELRDKDVKIYERTKEKVIGRVVAIAPDVAGAFAGFLETMTKVKDQVEVCKFLNAEKDLISGIFETSQALNLRLLRYSMLEFARVFHQIPADLRENTEAMRYLLATFVALSISFHSGGGLGVEGLTQENGWERALWEVNGQKGDAPPKTALELIQEQFGGHPYVRLYNQVISAELALAWISRGHVTEDLLSRELRKTSVFMSKDPETWQTLWWWEMRTDIEVEAALEVVKKQIVKMEFHAPEVIMHLTGIMLNLADSKIGWEARDCPSSGFLAPKAA
ncbi:P-loop NTPase fold protein [Yoonia sp. MH D7]